MTPIRFLAAIGAISLVTLVTTTILRTLVRLADERRARHATRHLVGRTYWAPDPIVASWFGYQPAVMVESPRFAVGTQRLPRGWKPSGKVIDVEVRS